MAGQQSKGLRVSAQTKGWDPTPAWFNPQFDAPPDPGNNSYLPDKGAIPANQPNPSQGTYNNPELTEKVTWSKPEYTQQPPEDGDKGRTRNANPNPGMPM